MHLPDNTSLQDGRYVIKRFISSGGFGCTYEAEHTLLEKRVAIKEFFVKDFCNRDEVTARVTVGTQGKKALVDKLRKKFLDEAKSLCKLHHSGIVSVFDVFEENGTAYYVMDYIAGSSLAALVKNDGPLCECDALGYIRQLCEALKYIHESHRLHLDIKPGNIMVDATGNAILIDFGASKQYDEVDGENTSTLMGHTPGYAPLEQMGNDVVQFFPSTDIYALGATLYKLLTGVTPLNATRLASGESLAPLPSALGAGTRAAVVAAMKLKKTERPQSIDEFLDILDGKVTVENNEKTIINEDDEKTVIVNDNNEPEKPLPISNPEKRKSEKLIKSKDKNKVVESQNDDTPVTASSIVKNMVIFLGIFLISTIAFHYSEKSILTGLIAGVGLTVGMYLFYRSCIFVKNMLRGVSSFKKMSKEERIGKMPSIFKRTIAFSVISVAIYVVFLILGGELFSALFWTVPCVIVGYILYRSCKIFLEIFTAMRSASPGAKQVKMTMLAVVCSIAALLFYLYFSSKQNVDYSAVAQPVDLGLSVEWASWNVGATSPEERGGQYAWGETDAKYLCRIANYDHTSQLRMDISGSAYDVASKKWGNGWRMPTEAEMNELKKQCTWTWTTYNGVEGYKVVGSNGNSIFLPVTGYRETDMMRDRNKGCYWTGTYKENWAAANLNFDIYNIDVRDYAVREFGRSVRAVKE